MKNDTDEYVEPYAPYYLVSKQTGEFTPLPLTVSRIKHTWIRQQTSETHYRQMGLPFTPLIRNGEELFISDLACDTIHAFSGGKFLPLMVIRGADDGDRVWLLNKTTRYSFLSVMDVGKEEEFKYDYKIIGIDHKTGEIFRTNFWNADFAEGDAQGYVWFNPVAKNLPAESAVTAYPALSLVDWRDAGKLRGRLAEVVAGMKEDDNPVLMFVKFSL